MKCFSLYATAMFDPMDGGVANEMECLGIAFPYVHSIEA